MSVKPVLVVHGGAGAHAVITQDGVPKAELEEGIIKVARVGYAVLLDGGSAVDAVEAAVAAMEDNPVFNAGRGSCLTAEGKVEMDASIMDGHTLHTGAVACIGNVTNPVSVARRVMDKTHHVMLVGEGATKFAEKEGITMVDAKELITLRSQNRLDKLPHFHTSKEAEFYDNETSNYLENGDHDTVGAVALDKNGHVAYATSTGGITAKMPGRVGDSPIVGSGGYAIDKTGAVSSTGFGECFVKITGARHAVHLMENGSSPQSAAEETLDYMDKKVQGQGGFIIVSKSGETGVHFTTEAMVWASFKDGNIVYGIYPGEKTTLRDI